jgi:predicted nucleic acid-binding protein
LNGWLLDTNIVSELRRPRQDKNVLAFLASQPIASLHVSEVSIAEIRYGVELVSDPIKRAILTEWLTNKVRPMFEGRTLPVSEDVLVKWRLLVEEGRKKRHTYSQPDLFIAATAMRHGLTVVTRDTSQFERAGVAVKNPWI